MNGRVSVLMLKNSKLTKGAFLISVGTRNGSRWLHNGILHSGPGFAVWIADGKYRCAGLQLSHVPHRWVGGGVVCGSTHPVPASPSRLVTYLKAVLFLLPPDGCLVPTR